MDGKSNESKSNESKITNQTIPNCDEIIPKRLLNVMDSEIRKNGMVNHHLSSYNKFLTNGIPEIVQKVFINMEKSIQNERNITSEDQSIEKIMFRVDMSDVKLEKPETHMFKSGTAEPLYPSMARRHDLNYSGVLSVTAKITSIAYHKNGTQTKREEIVKDIKITKIPIMVGSIFCNTYGRTKQELILLNEDPLEEGGLFILNGREWAIDNMENRLFNYPHIFRNVGHGNEITRLEIISKPGDNFENSSELKIRILTDGSIVLQLTKDYLSDHKIPFYLIFRLLGVVNDAEIFDVINYGKEDYISVYMRQILEKAMKVKDSKFPESNQLYNTVDILKYLCERLYTKFEANKDPKVMQYLVDSLYKSIDTGLFPHIGETLETRPKKILYLGHLIHKMILVEMKVLPSTDRDSYANKRVSPAGNSYSKLFKKHWNLQLVQPVIQGLTKDFQNTSFSNVKLANSFKTSIKNIYLEKSLGQAIASGQETATVGKQTVHIALTSEQVHRKNQLNLLSTLRVITTPKTSSKADERANLMRRVHSTYLGYVCPCASADTGEKVGLQKTIAITATISLSQNSETIKEKVRQCEYVRLWNTLTNKEIYENFYSKVFVNGDLIGFTQNTEKVWYKFKQMKKTGEILSKTTVYWDPIVDEVHMWCDVGRVHRPLIVIKNNVEEILYNLDNKPDEVRNKLYVEAIKKFSQDTILTQKDLDKLMQKTITIDDLIKSGVVEYMSAEEQLNAVICKSIEELRECKNDRLNQYTHLEIGPAILGVAALTTPYGNSDQAPRLTFQTNQGKQAAGWYALNFAQRVDKDGFMQYLCERPLVRTIASEYTYPNGMNAMVAVCTMGFNQEDSLILNGASIDRGMFVGNRYSFESAKLESRKEIFKRPDISITQDVKTYANYEKLDGFVVKKGTYIVKDDVLIAKMVKIEDKEGSDYKYIDKSILYKHEEPAIIEDVIMYHNQEGIECCKIKWRNVRPPIKGDKFSSRHGQKGICGIVYSHEDMPQCENGLTPDIIMNPHAIPTRMTIGQYKEALVALLCAMTGTTVDGSIFTKLDMDEVRLMLTKFGFSPDGTQRMYNADGEAMDVEIFITPIYYQRLQKFVLEEKYAVATSHTCPLTRQPTEGKTNQGGLRLGEMEKDVYCAHGTMKTIGEKFFHDSDGFDMYICKKCGGRPIVNIAKNIFQCKTCEFNTDIAQVHGSWASKTFFDEQEACGIGMKFLVEPNTYETHL